MKRKRRIKVVAENEGRVDKVASALSGAQRSAFSHEESVIHVNGEVSLKSRKVKKGDVIELEWEEEIFPSLQKEDINLDVIYEDRDILVINKEEGVVVHPGAGVHSGTIVNALLYRYGEEFLNLDSTRPGIVHRLDKDTSGVMVIAKNLDSLKKLQKQFSSRKVAKKYIAAVKGNFKIKRGTIDGNIERDKRNRKKFRVTEEGGREAHTEYRVLAENEEKSLLSVHIFTGRTHQIRVHLSSISHPVIGDSIYSKDKPPLMLHSYSLSFSHPKTGETLTFKAPLPDRIKDLFPGEDYDI